MVEERTNKRLLVISHNAFGKVNNMGRTLDAMFSKWMPDNIAQLYFSNEEPTSSFCSRYYKITDASVLRSVITRNAKVKTPTNVERKSEKSDDALRSKRTIYQRFVSVARSRTPATYIARNIIWMLGKWDTKNLYKCIGEFAPECIYFASGDYLFSYKVALKIAKKYSVPLIVGCFDDFYMAKRKSLNPLYFLNRWWFMRIAKKTFSYASAFTATCQLMEKDYEALFQKPGITLYTPADVFEDGKKIEANVEGHVIYAGNLGYGRASQLVDIGRTLLTRGEGCKKYLHVYSSETRNTLTDLMCKENGIVFHGAVSHDEIERVYSNASFVIHTESFENKNIQRVKYSVSTKIADCLGRDTPIIAYGPSDVASIEYLMKNDAAFCICSRESLSVELDKILSLGMNRRKEIVNNANELARSNHDKERNFNLLMGLIEGARK